MQEQDQPLTKRQRRLMKKQEQADQKAQQAQRKTMTRWLMIVILIAVVGEGI